jgi:hypothetical protein
VAWSYTRYFVRANCLAALRTEDADDSFLLFVFYWICFDIFECKFAAVGEIKLSLAESGQTPMFNYNCNNSPYALDIKCCPCILPDYRETDDPNQCRGSHRYRYRVMLSITYTQFDIRQSYAREESSLNHSGPS